MIKKDFKILLIDDDEDDYVGLRDFLSELTRAKYNLVWKSSYEEGLASLFKDFFDVCILDYRLGEKTGLELLAEARAGGSACPVILLTGHGDFDLDLTAMNAGAADYLVKGQISPPLLERSIRYSVKNARDMQQLADERENFQKLFNSTFEGIVVYCEGKILAANRAAGDIFNCSPEKIIERKLNSFLRSDFRDELLEQFNSGRDLRSEGVGYTLEGKEIYLGLSSRTVNINGHWASLIAIRDLTERRMMESKILQQDRLASLGLLASSLAHEIGTPLGVIRGRAEQIQRKEGDPKTKDTMGLIVSQIDRISKLVSSLLQIARGSNADATTEVNLNSALNDVLKLMSHEIERNGITLNTSVLDGITVQAESGPLAQVFLNLLLNAIHAILKDESNRKRKITISAVEADREVRISVEDSGVGINEKDFSRLFQPFFTTKDIGEGTGLGLATAYKLVSSWGGSIDVQSKVGQGSTFTVILRNSETPISTGFRM